MSSIPKLKSVGEAIACLEMQSGLDPVGTAFLLRGHIRELSTIADVLLVQHGDAILGRVIAAVSLEWRVPATQLLGRSRWQPLALARQASMVLYRRMAGRSLREVGEAFGDRDHGTVSHAEQAVRNALETDPEFAARFERCLSTLSSKP